MRRPGDVAEWLGRGLQSLVQRFEANQVQNPSIYADLRVGCGLPDSFPGALAERLGTGLQSLVRRFESATRLLPKVAYVVLRRINDSPCGTRQAPSRRPASVSGRS